LKARISIVFTCLLLSVNAVFSQTTFFDISKPSPTRETICSAIAPGLGQAHNRNYWKIPIIYAGFGGLGYGMYFYQRQYKEYRNVYDEYRNAVDDAKKNDNPPPSSNLKVFGEYGYSPESVRARRDDFRRYRDMCIIGASAWYLLNILDAYVYANLFDFDVSDDLSFHISPSLIPTANARLSPGLNISFSF